MGDWSISFQQFIASFLNQPELVNYFDRKIDLTEGLDKIKAARLQKKEAKKESSSAEAAPGAKSKVKK